LKRLDKNIDKKLKQIDPTAVIKKALYNLYLFVKRVSDGPMPKKEKKKKLNNIKKKDDISNIYYLILYVY